MFGSDKQRKNSPGNVSQSSPEQQSLLLGDDLARPSGPEFNPIKLAEALRGVSPTEMKYRLRRILVMLFGLMILALPFVGIHYLKAAFSNWDESSGAGREFVGSFIIRVGLEDATGLPGQPPVAVARALPDTTTSEWVSIFSIQSEGQESVENSYAEFVSSSVAFVLLDSVYAITTNGGHTWDRGILRTLHETDTTFKIDGVTLDDNGVGYLFPVGVTALDSAWYTEDYGYHWTAPES